MTAAAYIAVSLFATTFVELLLDSFGINLPLVAILCFYFAVAQGPLAGAACAFVGGASLDFLLGRSDPCTILLLLLVMVMGQIWLRRFEASSNFMLCIPGALLPIIVLVPWSLPPMELSTAWFASFLDCISAAFMESVCSAILLPVMVYALDFIAGSLEIELFADAKARLAEQQ